MSDAPRPPEIDIVTIFPGMFSGFLMESLFGKFLAEGRLIVRLHNLRNFTSDRHLRVDDVPYGGGPGMLLSVEPVFRAFRELGVIDDSCAKRPQPRVLFPSPSGKPLEQATLRRLATEPRLLILCGHYEGIDERIFRWVDEEISLGDYVLSGGELAAMVLCDGIFRMLEGALGNPESAAHDSFFQESLLEHPQYTRPREFMGESVPEILFSGHHAEIEKWQRRLSLLKTARVRPELLSRLQLSREERGWLEKQGVDTHVRD